VTSSAPASRSVWNVVAVIVTLALTVAVAVVAVTKGEPKLFEAAPTLSPSASPSASPSPKGLDGDGPFIVYATDQGAFAYDVAGGTTKRLGSLTDLPVGERSHQPGNGRVVAFPTQDGSVWRVTRAGMARVGVIPSADGDRFQGAVLSPDDRRLAVEALAPEPATLIVDLDTGRTTAIRRVERRGNTYPKDFDLLPIAWSLGGSLIYEIPSCDGCDGIPGGLYTIDTSKGTSTLVTGTGQSYFLDSAISASAQSVFYGTATRRRCPPGPAAGPCSGPPFALRRLAAGRRGPETLERDDAADFRPAAISPDGGLLLVRRVNHNTEKERVDLFTADGQRESPIRGLRADAEPLALLPRDVVVATLGADEPSLVVVSGGRSRTVATKATGDDSVPVFLGWLL
jgi:hypothetical protein